MSSPCTVPATERSLLWKQQRDSANSEVAADESFPQRARSAQRLAHLPIVCCPEFGRHMVWQLNEGVPLLFRVERRSPNVEYGHDNVLPHGSPSCVCDHSFDSRQVRRPREVLVFVSTTATELLCDPPGSQLWSMIGPLIDCDPSDANDTAPFLCSRRSRNDVIDSHPVYEVFLLHLGTMDQKWIEFFEMPNCSRMPRLC